MRYGVVTGIDRVNRLVGAVLDDGLQLALPQGFPYRGDPPCPFTRCSFSELGNGSLICDGSLGSGRVILHDDFTLVGLAGANPEPADTPWTVRISGAGPNGAQSGDTDQQGATVTSMTAVLNQWGSWSKDIGVFAPTPPAALWMSARWKPANTTLGALLTLRRDVVGLGDAALWNDFAAGYDAVAWVYEAATSANYIFRSAAAGLVTDVTSAVAAADSFAWFDIVHIAGIGSAGWVNGDGPYLNGGQVPPAGTALAPGFMCKTTSAATRFQTLDVIHLEYVPEVIDPQTNFDLAAQTERVPVPRPWF